MVGAIVICGLLVGVAGISAIITMAGCSDQAERINRLERDKAELSRRVNSLHGVVHGAHGQLVDRLWQRASVDVDREIEKARARGRQT
jgi:hypothetical protein